MYRVEEISKEIAKKLELDEEHIKLAELIGLLHDIGRFEQYRVFDQSTPTKEMDISIEYDHGKEGVNVLKKDDYIRNFIEDNKYDEIIYKSIYNHNKYKIEEVSKEENLFCKLVRDADKIDIFYESIYIFWQKEKEIEEVENGIIPDKLLKSFYQKELINSKNLRIGSMDSFIRMLAFIFDINFRESFEIIKQNNYINKIIDRFNFKSLETKEKIREIRNILNEYIEEKSKI